MKNMGEVFQLSQGCSAAVRHGAPCGSFVMKTFPQKGATTQPAQRAD